MKKLMTLIMVLGAIEAFGVTYYSYNGGDDLTNTNSYRLDGNIVPTRLPGASDYIYVRNGHPFTLRVTDAASWEIFNTVNQIVFESATAYMTIEMSTDGTLTVPFPASGKGVVIKTGSGTLTLDNDYTSSYSSGTYYFRMLDIREGAVMCAPNISGWSGNISLPIIKVAEGTTFGAPPVYYNTALSLCGAGTIASSKPGTKTEFRLSRDFNWADDPREFSGVFSEDVFFFNPRTINLTGTQSTMKHQLYNHFGKGTWGEGGMIGVMKFGNDGEPSSIGKHGTPHFNVRGGVFKYLGKGETTTKDFSVAQNAVGDFAGFDGGPNGGLVLKGNIYSSSDTKTSSTNMLVLGFGGSNATPCEVQSTIYAWKAGTTVNRGFSIFKRDPGAWLFSDKGNGVNDWVERYIYGAIRVEGGTLQFNSLNKKGEPCALGLGDYLFDPQVVSPIVVEEKNLFVDYNFQLGTATSEGALESVTTNAIDATTRPFALGGNGRLINNSNFRAWYRALAPLGTGARTLTLSGSSTAENSVFDVTDNDNAKVSIVKEGEGTWYLKGDQTFRGDIEVNGGTLIASKPSNNNFSWYRFTVRSTQPSLASGSWSTNTFGLKFMGFYAGEAGNYALLSTNITMAAGNHAAALEPGQSGHGIIDKLARGSYSQDVTSGSKVETDRLFLLYDNYGVFCPKRLNWTGLDVTYFDENNPKTEWPIVVRLGSNATAVDSFDFAVIYGWNTTSVGGFTSVPKKFRLEGSIDGCHWENAKLDGGDTWEITTNDYYSTRTHAGWVFAGKESQATVDYNSAGPNASSAKKHMGGCQIRGEATTTYNMLNNWSGKVKLSGSGTLKLENATTKAITSLTLDETANKLDGFSLADTGTIDVKTATPKTDLNLNTTFENHGNTINNLTTWNVSINGTPSKLRKVEIVEGKIVIRRPGMLLLFK